MSEPIGCLYYERLRDQYWVQCVYHGRELKTWCEERPGREYKYWDIYPEQIYPFTRLPCYSCGSEGGDMVFPWTFKSLPPEEYENSVHPSDIAGTQGQV